MSQQTENDHDDSWESPIIRYPGDDEDLVRAYQRAQETFGHYLREMTWEYRRIIPGVQISQIKARFDDEEIGGDGDPEHMWIADATFDGIEITGTLNNDPNWLKSVKAGDTVTFPLSRLSDWLLVVGQGEVYGGFTIQVMRARMDPNERAAHDQAWGLDFGDPNDIALGFPLKSPEPPKAGGVLKRLLGRGKAEEAEDTGCDPSLKDHPMAVNMAPDFVKFLAANPGEITSKDEDGMTMLHSMCLGGSAVAVDILLRHGADPNAVTNNGMTPLKLAEILRWDQIVDLLRAKGAR